MAQVSKKVYLASDMLVAFIDRTHARHEQAAAFFRYFALETYHLYTDTVSLYDSFREINDGMSHLVAKDFIRTVMQSNITLLYPDESDMRAAFRLYTGDRTNELTLRKAVMAVMADRKAIPQIATFEYMQTMFGLTVFYIPI